MRFTSLLVLQFVNRPSGVFHVALARRLVRETGASSASGTFSSKYHSPDLLIESTLFIWRFQATVSSVYPCGFFPRGSHQRAPKQRNHSTPLEAAPLLLRLPVPPPPRHLQGTPVRDPVDKIARQPVAEQPVLVGLVDHLLLLRQARLDAAVGIIQVRAKRTRAGRSGNNYGTFPQK